jgi:hypothetical protein
MRKYPAVLALIFALAIYVAIQDQSSAAKFAKQGTTQTDTVSAADTHNNHPPKSTEDTKWNPPGWHRLFAWPEGIETKASIESFDHREAFSGRVTILYAVVKYKNAFGPHETWRGYLIRGDLGHGWLERLAGYEEYNKYS